MTTWPILSVTTFLPLVGALFITLMHSDGEAEKRNARWIALWTTLITLVISLILLYRFDPSSPTQIRVNASLIAPTAWESGTRQVIDNLLSNAAKYSPADTVIGVHTFTDGEWVRTAVSDRGVGIRQEHLARLFDRFYRVPVEDGSAPPGFGLGLSIVRDLVEAHGGRVEVASDGPGTGCTFSVVLPVMLPMNNEPTPSEAVKSG